MSPTTIYFLLTYTLTTEKMEKVFKKKSIHFCELFVTYTLLPQPFPPPKIKQYLFFFFFASVIGSKPLNPHCYSPLHFLDCLILKTRHKSAIKKKKIKAFCNLNWINKSKDGTHFCQVHDVAYSDQLVTRTPGLFATAVLPIHLYLSI